MKNYILIAFLILIVVAILMVFRPVNVRQVIEDSQKSEINSGYFIGEVSAKPFVIFEDYQCPVCKKFALEIEPKIHQEYVKNNKIKIIVKFYPILGKESWDAAIAANCAGKQGKFWEYREILFENQFGENLGRFKEENLIKFASLLNLNIDNFKSCLNDENSKKEVEKDFNLGKSLKIYGTPSFWFDGKTYIGFLDYGKIKDILK
jgi:protein-disulfide isomerase